MLYSIYFIHALFFLQTSMELLYNADMFCIAALANKLLFYVYVKIYYKTQIFYLSEMTKTAES